MNEVVCNYAIARFRPYRETGEFVNVGVVLACPQLNFFGQAFERRKHKRVTDFFPELDLEVYKLGRDSLIKELKRRDAGNGPDGQSALEDACRANLAAFKEFVRPREGIFYFSDISTVLASEPKEKLRELFEFYVQRQFAQDREYQETVMRHRLSESLKKADLSRFYELDYRVGNDGYNVVLPFVHFADTTPIKAIKPLDLDKAATTDIYRHGDSWISTVQRLKRIGCLPKELLFVVRTPEGDDKRQSAADEVRKELENANALTVPFEETKRILAFAQC